MSSEFDQYFQEFLGDASNEFDIFKGDFSSEPERLHHSDDWQFDVEDRAASSLHPSPLVGDLASNTPNPAPWRPGEISLPEADVCIGVWVWSDSPIDSLNHGSPTVVSPALSSCLWMSCSTRSAERNEAEMTAHLEAHWKESLDQWRGPRGCNWPDCPSRATFKSPSSLKSHIFNIHVNPLVCTYPQCTYPNPFSKQCDLRRHIETVHEASCSHICPVELCEAHVKGFARKDKLLNHLREQHDNLRCPYNHCHAAVLETEQETHLQQFHGSFECALGACGMGPASRFLEIGLRRHLRRHHNMTSDPIGSLLHRVLRTEDKTARPAHIVRLRKWKDCPACSEAQSALEFGQNNEDFRTQSENKIS